MTQAIAFGYLGCACQVTGAALDETILRTGRVALPFGHVLEGESIDFLVLGDESIRFDSCARNVRGRWSFAFSMSGTLNEVAYRCRQLAAHFELIAMRTLRKGQLVLVTEEAGLTFGLEPGSEGEVTEVLLRGAETLYRVKLCGESETPRVSELLLFAGDLERANVASDDGPCA